MIIIEKSISLNVTKDEIWKSILTLNEHYSELSKNHLTYKCISGTPNKPGSIYKVRQYFRGKIVELTFKLAEIVKEKRLVLISEFPYVLLGLRVTLELTETNNGTSIYEKIEFGFDVFPFDRMINPLIKIFLCSGLSYIKNDQIERMKGFKKIFSTESVLSEIA